MVRPVSSILAQLGLALIPLGLTATFFAQSGEAQSRPILLGLLACETTFLCWLAWKLALPPAVESAPPIPLPRTDAPDRLPERASPPPKPREPYSHRPTQPSRLPERQSDPIPNFRRPAPRNPRLPELPTLPVPQPNRSGPRNQTPTPRPAAPKPARPVIRLGDLLPPSAPAAPRSPSPQPATTPTSGGQQRPKRPYQYAGFSADSANLPTALELSELQLCSDILSLGFACAACDGPVSKEEDDHLTGWMWCVIDATAHKDAAAFLQKLSETSANGKMRGKLKLEEISKLAQAIRAAGERKLTQCAGALCGEIVELDGKLEPGEFATLSVTLKELGVRNVKALKVAEELISNDDEIVEMKEELELDDDTPKETRERILSMAWSRENARMQAVTDSARREDMRRRMNLIQRIRDLYRELDQHG